jgi:hypothetical protein
VQSYFFFDRHTPDKVRKDGKSEFCKLPLKMLPTQIYQH